MTDWPFIAFVAMFSSCDPSSWRSRNLYGTPEERIRPRTALTARSMASLSDIRAVSAPIASAMARSWGRLNSDPNSMTPGSITADVTPCSMSNSAASWWPIP